MVTVIKKEVEVAKETMEIFDALSGIAADIKAKKQIAELVAGNLTKLIAAVEGFDKLSEEFKAKQLYMSLGVGMGQVGEALLYKAPEAVPQA